MALDVPYPQLRAAEKLARNVFPNAEHVKAIWTPASEREIAVEVGVRDERTGNLPIRVLPYDAADGIACPANADAMRPHIFGEGDDR